MNRLSEQEVDTFAEVCRNMNHLIDNINLIETKVLVLDKKEKSRAIAETKKFTAKKKGSADMKTVILSAFLSVALLVGSVFGEVSKDRINFNTMSTTNGVVAEVRNLIDDINTELTNAGGRFANIGTGNIYYVDSATGNDNRVGTRPQWATATGDAAVALTTANNGDVIVFIQNHGESLSAADGMDVDVAGVAVIGLGDGTDAPEFTYTTTTGEIVIGADNVLLYNLRLIAATESIVNGISIEASVTSPIIMNCVFPEPTTVANEFLDAIDVLGDVSELQVYNCIYRNTSTTGPVHFLDMGNGVNNDMRLVGNDIQGNFSVSALWSDTVDENVFISRNHIRNKTAGQHGIEFTAAATGLMTYNIVATNVSATSIDPGSINTAENYVINGIDNSGILFPAAP